MGRYAEAGILKKQDLVSKNVRKISFVIPEREKKQAITGTLFGESSVRSNKSGFVGHFEADRSLSQ